MHDEVNVSPPVIEGRRQVMRYPDEVAAMLRLHGLGWGTRRIAAELGCDRETVQRYLAAGGWAAYRGPRRPSALAGHEAWLAERFRRHRGNADVVRQELAGELGVSVSLRTVERAVMHLRRELAAEALATVRFETPPGQQLQIDFGEVRVCIEGEDRGKLHLFVATLGYSRRVYVRAFRHERQSAWLDGIEGAFRHFGGLPAELLMDNAKALVVHHDAATREVVFNDRLHAFARYWGVRPVACAPYRARTKGKDERGVGYVKGNAIAGRSFASWSALEAHLVWWMREVADARVHGTTGEVPAVRFVREERQALRLLDGRPPFRQMRELTRRVQNDACVDVDTNHYSVPWTLIGAMVSVVVSGGEVRVHHAGTEVACHDQRRGRRERAVDRAHLHGILARCPGNSDQPGAVSATPDAALPGTDLLRSLAEYEQVVGGGW
jgi:transposase